MASAMLPSPQDIQSVVEEEVANAGGETLDRLSDGRRLFLRCVLPVARQIRKNDNVQGGVAVMVGDLDIRVHPFTFREVCRNGAIMAQTIDTRRIRRVEFDAPPFVVTEVLSEVRESVRECSAPEVFSSVAGQLHTAANTAADLAIHLLPMLARFPQHDVARILTDIMGEYTSEGDDSVFGLMNAVTSVAREEPDPEVRWDLEELGGGIPAMVPDVPKPSDTAADILQTAFGA